MKPLVLFHRDCQDGWCAAWAARQRFGDDAEYMAVQYGDDPPSFDLIGRDVYILDFSYLPEFIEEMAREAKTVTLLDHHRTAEEQFRAAWNGEARAPYTELVTWTPCENVTVLLDQSRSGAQLAYDYFMGIGPCTTCKTSGGHADNCPVGGSLYRPWIVDYVADRDLWQWKLPQSREVNAYLRSIPQDFEAWDALAEIHEDADDGLGALLARYESICRDATPGPWSVRVVGPDDHRTIMVVGPPGSGRWEKDPSLPLVIAEMRLPSVTPFEIHANWDLMATVRKALPDLIAEIRKTQRTPVQVAAILGTAILAAQDREIERAVKRARRVTSMTIPPWPFDVVALGRPFVVNATENISEVLEQLAKEPPHWAIGWYQGENGSYRYSLRSASNGPDVAKIAEAWSGGGHKHASGFESKTTVF